MTSKVTMGMAAALLLVAALLWTMTPAATVQGAPAAVVTPSAPTGYNARPATVVELFDNQALTADTRSSCADISGHSLADVQWEIDQGTTNTTTLTLQHAVDGDIDWETLDTLATDNAADADGLTQHVVWARFLCAYANVSTTDTVTVTVKALLR